MNTIASGISMIYNNNRDLLKNYMIVGRLFFC